MKPEEMPSPDALIEDEDGSVTCPMFFYAPENVALEDIVSEHGFKAVRLLMEHDLGDDHPLIVDYFDAGNEARLAEWQPECPPGWKLAAKNDSEDGPVAIFIQPIEPASPVAA